MTDFDKILYRNEFTSLAGRSYRTILALSAILLLTILVLGLSSGSLADLRKRMENPYTNWIDIPVTSSMTDSVEAIRRYFQTPTIIERYDIRHLGEHDVYYHAFMTADGRDAKHLKGSTVDPSESIVKSVLHEIPENLIVQHSNFDSLPCGLIVTRSFLTKLGYAEPVSRIKKISIPIDGYVLLIDIVAIVEELPSLNEFFSCAVLKNMVTYSFHETGFLSTLSTNIYPLLVEADAGDDPRDALLTYFEKFNPRNITPQDRLVLHVGTEHQLMNVVFALDSFPDHLELNKFIAENPHPEFRIIPYKEFLCNTNGFSDVRNTQHLAFHFASLDNVRAFQEEMVRRFGVEVSMQQIESADNFTLVSTLTKLLSWVLFGFAMLSIGFYISSVVRSHLQKIIPNLGTLKAFGIRNQSLITIYVGIIGTFCILAIAVSFILSIPIQYLLTLQGSNLRIDIFSVNVLLSLLIITIVCTFITWRATRRIISHTPGNLVYHRI